MKNINNKKKSQNLRQRASDDVECNNNAATMLTHSDFCKRNSNTPISKLK